MDCLSSGARCPRSPSRPIITATACKNPVSVAAPAFTIKVLPTLSVAGAPAGPVSGFVGLPFNAGPYAASGIVGTPSFQLFQVFSDGELQDSIDIASLCPGLTLDGLTGTIAGLPTAPCDAALRMFLTDGFDHTTVTDGSLPSWPNHLVTLRTEGEVVTLVADPAPILNIAADTATATLTSPSTVRVGEPVTGTLVTDLPAPVWSFVSSPPGLILTADGNTFSGPSFSGVAPQVSSPTPFSVIATVTSGPVSLAAAPFSLTVAPVLALAGGPAADLGFTVGTSVVPTPAITAGTTAIGALSLALVTNRPVALPSVPDSSSIKLPDRIARADILFAKMTGEVGVFVAGSTSERAMMHRAALRLGQQHIDGRPPPDIEPSPSESLDRATDQHPRKVGRDRASHRCNRKHHNGGDQVALVAEMPCHPDRDRHTQEH
jgi:hypothetical protein